ncbi:MAG: hypothetical protein KF861_19815 [Planctomycetaceae bacterium]|nr:hypothetical protein [Planctomycetaceae bacterium]
MDSEEVEQVLSRIAECVLRFPELECLKFVDRIVAVTPDRNGFDVGLDYQKGVWTVNYDGWHDHFNTPEDAEKCFQFGLTGACRIKIEWRGKFPYRFTLQVPCRDGQSWCDESAAGRFLYPYWRYRTVTFLQNQLVAPQAISSPSA